MSWIITGPDITDAAGKPSPSTEEAAWATKCANAVNAAIATRLNGYVVEDDEAADLELRHSAVLDGLEAYRAKDARMGILSVGPDGEPVRVSTDILWSVPVIGRYATPGMG